MKRFMSTTAIVATMLAAGTMATAQSDSVFTDYQVEPQDDLFASDLIGARIYASETEVGETAEEGAEQEWDDLGEINDMIMNSDGTPEVVVLGIGGFLGIGERDIAVNFDQIQIVRDGEQADDYFLVINATQEEIEAAPEFQRAEPMAEGTGTGMESGTGTDSGMNTGDAAATDPAMSTDSATGEAGQEMNEAAGEAENAAEDAANSAESAADSATEATGDAAEEAGQEMEEAGQEMEQAGEEMEQEAESETESQN